MEILLKKDSSNKTTTNIKELSEKLEIASLRKALRDLKVEVENLKKLPQIEEKDVISITSSLYIKKGDLSNITHAPSIEKLKSVSVGTIYYNKTKDLIRLKVKQGWVSLKGE